MFSATARLGTNPEAAGTARLLVSGLLEAASAVDRFPDAVLVVSELVTNAVVHTGSSTIVVDVTLREDDRLRLDVIDGDRVAVPELRHPEPDQIGGRGMMIVDRLSAAWGVEPNGTSKVVWAELRAIR